MAQHPYLFTRNRTRIDVTNIVVCSLLAVFCVGPFALVAMTGPSSSLAVALTSLVMIFGLYFRLQYPFTALAIITFGAFFQWVFCPYPTPALIVVPIISYSVARQVPGHKSRWVLFIGAVGSTLAGFSWSYRGIDYDYLSYLIISFLLTFICLTLVVTPYVFGRRVYENEQMELRRQQAILESYRQRLLASQEQARAAEAKTRNDIARELHDIVAHSLSVMIVLAEGGRAQAKKNPEKASQTLDTIAENGRQALQEMRRIVGVLRADPNSPADYAPSPTLQDVPELVARSGERVQLKVTGQIPQVQQTLGLAVYRVIQEAVTNFLKHAGPEAKATVSLTFHPDRLVAEVIDDGLGSQATNDGHGNGLNGMQERVAGMGGNLVAIPLTEKGFIVRAVLPLKQVP